VAVKCEEIVIEEEGKWRAGLKNLGKQRAVYVEQAVAVIALCAERKAEWRSRH
jgi:hypothetical protein